MSRARMELEVAVCPAGVGLHCVWTLKKALRADSTTGSEARIGGHNAKLCSQLG